MLARHRAFVLACGCVGLAAAAPLAQAQGRAAARSAGIEPSIEPSAEDAPRADAVRAAREHFKAASEDYRAGRFREALHGFELAERLVPSPELSFNIARASEQLGDIERAVAGYERYLAARPDAPDAPSVRARLAGLRASLAARPADEPRAALRIDAAPGARLALDGEDLGLAPIDRILWIEPGRHELRAELEGHAPFRAAIDAPAGGMVAGNVELVPHAARPPGELRAAAADAPAAAAPVWIAGGVSIASAIASVAARASAEASRSAGDLAAADGAGTVAGVALATALTAGVLATVLYLATPAHGEASTVLQ